MPETRNRTASVQGLDYQQMWKELQHHIDLEYARHFGSELGIDAVLEIVDDAIGPECNRDIEVIVQEHAKQRLGLEFVKTMMQNIEREYELLGRET